MNICTGCKHFRKPIFFLPNRDGGCNAPQNFVTNLVTGETCKILNFAENCRAHEWSCGPAGKWFVRAR